MGVLMLCRNCNRLAQESATRVWIVDILACRCIILPIAKS
jgi:hypothetical protein